MKLHQLIIILCLILATQQVNANKQLKLPDFAIVNIQSESLKNHRWNYQPGSHFDVYQYHDSTSENNTGITIRLGTNLAKIYANSQLDSLNTIGVSKTQEMKFLEEQTEWFVNECNCHQATFFRSTLTQTKLNFKSKPIWIHVQLIADKQTMPKYMKWIQKIKLQSK